MPGKTLTPEGTVLLQLRRQSGWTQARLERTARLTRGTLSLYETGKRSISRPLLNRLAVSLGHSKEDVDRALAALTKTLAVPDAPVALTPASLLPHEHRAVEAAAERAAARVRLGVGTRLIEARLRSERNEAANLWDQLQKLPTFRACELQVDTDSRFRSWALSERLCDESRRAIAYSFSAGRRLARLAFRVAMITSGSDAWQAKVKGYALAFVANSLRVDGDLSGAEEKLTQARELWGKNTTPVPLDEGEIHTQTASLRLSQSRFLEARSLLSLAEQTAAQPAKRARLYLIQASVLDDQGSHDDALETLNAAQPLVAAGNQPRQLFELEFVRALCLSNLGHLSDSMRILGEIQHETLNSGNALDVFRVQWLVAEVWTRGGRKDKALEILSRVWEEFMKRGMTYYASQVALDISKISRKEDR